MNIWLNQHALALRLVLQRLRQHWLNTLIICMVIGITVTLPGLLFVALHNLQSVAGSLKQDAQVSVFLRGGLPANSVQRLINEIQALPTVKAVRFVTKEEAISQLAAEFSQQDLLADLPQNPLPDALFITLTDTTAAAVTPVQQALQKRNEVEELVVDQVWIARLHAMLQLGRQIAWTVAGLLGIAMMTVISNTVRMQVLTHAAEIEVSRLIGATHSFIRRPFLYMGSAYGLGGGVIAVLLLAAIIASLRGPVALLAQQYQSPFQLGFQWLEVGGWMLFSAISLGWLAALIALRAAK